MYITASTLYKASLQNILLQEYNAKILHGVSCLNTLIQPEHNTEIIVQYFDLICT